MEVGMNLLEGKVGILRKRGGGGGAGAGGWFGRFGTWSKEIALT